jgi:hypothetical protein
MDIIKFSFDKGFNLELSVNKYVIAFLVIGLVCLLSYKILLKRSKLFEEFEIDEAELGIGNQKIIIKPNYNDLQIAYKLWIELSTRKLGLPIDINNDVILEVYNSWYDFFKVTRELLKEMPIEKIKKNDSSQRIVKLAVDILNEGIRPHLTKWQAKYRKWYNEEALKDGNSNKSPQEIQRLYIDYYDLIKDLENVNKTLIEYMKLLKKILYK